MSLFDRFRGGEGSNGGNDGNKGGDGGGNDGKGSDGKGGGSNNQPNLNPFAKPSNNDNSGGNNQQQPSGGAQNQSPARDANADRAAAQNFYRQSGLYEGLDAQGLMTAVEKNDVQAVEKMLHTLAENAVTTALAGADKLTRARLERQAATTKDEATSATINHLTVRDMHEQLKFTQDESIRPIAEEVLQGFINQGKTGRDAIDATRMYFEKLMQSGGKALGYTVSKSDGRQGSFSGARAPTSNDNENGDGQDDWLGILTGDNHTE